MLTHVYIQELSKHVGEEVTLKGWLYNKTAKGKLVFLVMRDGTGYCQCVIFKGNVNDETFEAAGSLPQESSFEVKGIVKEEKRSVLIPSI